MSQTLNPGFNLNLRNRLPGVESMKSSPTSSPTTLIDGGIVADLVPGVVKQLQPLGDIRRGAEQVKQLFVIDLQQGHLH